MRSDGSYRAIVDQRHLPSPELAGAGYSVIHICERDARSGTGD
jgi:hypothetical protein